MRVVGGLVLALALRAAPTRAEVVVQYQAGRVDVRATSAPLTEVLDRLARATGMKIVQQGVTPSMLLSLSLQGRTPAEAVFGVLEGLGLNYAFILDASGTRIETLVLAGGSGPARPVAAASTPAPPSPTHRYVPQPSAPPPAAGPDESDEAVEEEPEEPPPDAEEEPVAGTPGGPAAPRGSVLQAPAEPVFPSSPFAPRAPVFSPVPEPPPPPPQAQPQPKPTPAPPDRNQ